ncbi:MAG: aromatic ring-hydroxylating oxygenase subunit alpha, partial [Gammaproteobacteria bacterium]
PHTTTKELLVPADQPIVRYRQHLKHWEENGWRIDVRKLNTERGDVAFAIPCPARRTERNWILDTVPTM